jgi:hypothetical protein
MASPFLGMDSHLEGDMWRVFHDRLAHQINAQLLPLPVAKCVALLANG